MNLGIRRKLFYYSVCAIIYLEIFIMKIIGLYKIFHICWNPHKNKNHNQIFWKTVQPGFYPHCLLQSGSPSSYNFRPPLLAFIDPPQTELITPSPVPRSWGRHISPWFFKQHCGWLNVRVLSQTQPLWAMHWAHGQTKGERPDEKGFCVTSPSLFHRLLFCCFPTPWLTLAVT